MMKGYKLIPPDWRCEGQNYSVGKTFWKKKEPADAQEGLLFCEEMRNCLHNCRLTPDTHMCEVEAIGDVYQLPYDNTVSYTNRLRIIREIPFRELMRNIAEYKLLEEDGCLIQYVEGYHTYDMCKTAVKQNGLALRFVKWQNQDICLAAVTQNPRALHLVQSKALQIELLITKVLVDHRHWKNKDCEGWENMRADLSGFNLSNITLENIDLSYVNMRDVHMKDVTMYKVDLSGADMTYASLSNVHLDQARLCATNLKQAYLSNVVMPHADLSNANLSGASLLGVDLRNANMKNVDLNDANIYDTDLCSADMQNADLKGLTILAGATLRNVKNLPSIPMACPENGEFIGWKKANRCIVKLIIPADAKRSSAISRKCRCDKAFVCSIIDGCDVVHDDPEEGFMVRSDRNHEFIYQVGKTVTVEDFDEDRFHECAPGIHFFMTQEEAMAYN